MLAKDIMSREPICCSPTTRLQEVAQKMVECDCGEIPVCDESGKPIGVVTDRDIVCRLVAQGKNPLEMTARDCMSTPVITTSPAMPIEDCARLMEQYQVRRLPVVEANGVICGIIAQADLATKAPHDTTIEVVEKVSERTTAASTDGH